MKNITGVDDPTYHLVSERLRRRFGPAPPANHVCNHQTCLVDAKSEEALVRSGFLSGPILTSNVFFTRCHSIHVCSENTCRLYAASHDGTCPVSGIQYGTMISSYDKNDSRTWYSRPHLETYATPATTAPLLSAPPLSTPVVAAAKVLALEIQKDCASGIIRLLLWSSKRETRNKLVHDRLVDEANNACSNYIKSQRQMHHQLPFWTDMYRIRCFMMSAEPMLQILQYDEMLHDYYVAIICQIWDRIVRFRPDKSEKLTRSDLEAVSLGVLYGMRQGKYERKGVVILSKDDFLAQELPPIQELNFYFGVDRSNLTRGQKLLRAAFDNAFELGVPHSEIELDMAAITQIAAVAVDTTVLSSSLGVTRDARNRRVKITNKGEVLFMPVSRKKA